jgi:predicted DNA-binding transcriptional regulator AlpA
MTAPAMLTMPEVLRDFARCSRGNLYKWIKVGLFPPGVHIGPGRIAWRREDLERWAASREVAHQSPREVV